MNKSFSHTFPVVVGQSAVTCVCGVTMDISKHHLLLFTPAGKFNPIINLFSLKESLVLGPSKSSAAQVLHYVIGVNV